jgi:hypothetical protein
LISTKFEKEIVFESSVLAWIRIEQKLIIILIIIILYYALGPTEAALLYTFFLLIDYTHGKQITGEFRKGIF